jgi:multiple sugar transport system permease protein
VIEERETVTPADRQSPAVPDEGRLLWSPWARRPEGRESPTRERGLWLLLAPYLVGIAILIVVPAAITFLLSLYRYDLLRPAEFIGLENFRELAGDSIFRTSLRNSLLYILFAVPLRLLGALGLALLLHKRFRGVAAYRTSSYLPTVVPDVAYALLWLWIFNPLYGPLNLVLDSIGVGHVAWLTSPTAARTAIVIMGLFTIGEGFIVAMATRQDIPGELYELAAIEGTGPLAAFRRITLPMMAPTLLLLLFRDTIFSFQANFVPALLVTGGGPPPYATTYLPLFIYRTGFEYLRYGYAAAATLMMFLITAAIVFVQYRIVKRWRHAFVV